MTLDTHIYSAGYYADGSIVKAGDRIRSKQRPGGMLPPPVSGGRAPPSGPCTALTTTPAPWTWAWTPTRWFSPQTTDAATTSPDTSSKGSQHEHRNPDRPAEHGPSGEVQRSFRVIGTEHDQTDPLAGDEGAARSIFHSDYPNETILSVTELIRKARA